METTAGQKTLTFDTSYTEQNGQPSVLRVVAEGFDLVFHDHDYTTVMKDKNNGEWQIVLVSTSRQDGKTHWRLLLVEVDATVREREGMTRYGTETDEALARAVGELTREARWGTPIN